MDDPLLPPSVEDEGDVGLDDDLERRVLKVLRGLRGLEITPESLTKCSQKVSRASLTLVNYQLEELTFQVDNFKRFGLKIGNSWREA